jgi:hypothetical protein
MAPIIKRSVSPILSYRLEFSEFNKYHRMTETKSHEIALFHGDFIH